QTDKLPNRCGNLKNVRDEQKSRKTLTQRRKGAKRGSGSILFLVSCLVVGKESNNAPRSPYAPINRMKSILKFSLVPLLLHALTSQATLTVTNIASGNYAYHSLFLKSDGSLWAMGYNNFGQLGDGTLIKTNRPEQIMPGGVTAIAAGGYHSLFLKSDGSLWAMGQNNFGQLGDCTLNRTNRPEQITNGVIAIAAGGNSGVALSGGGQSLFLKSDGSLWAMGDNGSGQLGDGTFNSTNRPELIVASGVTNIAAGASHSLFIKSDGSLWAIGGNSDGQLGDGTGINTNRPEQITNGV